MLPVILGAGVAGVLARRRFFGGQVGGPPPTPSATVQTNSVTVQPGQRLRATLSLQNNGGVQAQVTIHCDLVGNGKIQGHLTVPGSTSDAQVTLAPGQTAQVVVEESQPMGNQAQVGASLTAFFTLTITDVYGTRTVVYQGSGTITPPPAPANVTLQGVTYAVV